MAGKLHQRGVSMFTILFILIVLGGVGAMVMQAFPSMVEYQAALKAINKAKDEGTVAGVRSSFDKAADINSISSISGKDLEITKNGDQTVVSFAYQKEFHMFGPAWLTLKYEGPRVPAASGDVADALAALQDRLHHRFQDPALLARALTHRSFSAEHNERLEFLGDSVLNLAVAALLYDRLKSQPEGDLSRVRANLVKQDTLHQVAVQLGLPGLVRLGEGEARSGGHKRPSILADALEAIIGAVYLDAGFTAAEALVRRLFSQVEIKPQMSAAAKDPKTELQEVLQGRKMQLPVYRVVGTVGAAHKQTFDVECEVAELGLSERGIGASRRAAEQAAAAAMLLVLKTKVK